MAKDSETLEMQRDASAHLAPRLKLRGFHYQDSLTRAERKAIAKRYGST
jgi:hypothetical protein